MTTTTTHTPGPWEAMPVRLGLEWAEAYDIVYGDDQQILVNDVASEADAYLIAAAPDLLKALKAVVAIADRKTVEFDSAHAAIAKAEGKP